MAVSCLGDIWCFDKGHGLARASAHDPEVYRRLMGGIMARLVIADPPYNVGLPATCRGGPMCGVHRASGEMGSAEFTAFLSDAFELAAHHSLDGSLHLYFMDWRHVEEMMAAGRKVYNELKYIVVWTKTNAGMGSLWRSQHELVFAWKWGTAAHVNNVNLGRGGRWRSNVWNFPGANSFGQDRDRELADRPTPKNVAMIKEESSTSRGVATPCSTASAARAPRCWRRIGPSASAWGSSSISSMSMSPYAHGGADGATRLPRRDGPELRRDDGRACGHQACSQGVRSPWPAHHSRTARSRRRRSAMAALLPNIRSRTARRVIRGGALASPSRRSISSTRWSRSK